MLTKANNEKLTKVGPGTPGGELLRRYWHPIAASVEMAENPVKKVRLLCEDLVLYRDRSGTLGLIDEPCPHRRVSMEYGIPEDEGLRCPYHGWRFNQEGRCLEQPAEPWNSTFKDRVTTKAYPVEELGGLIWAYLGPQPAPMLPRYDVFVWDNVIRHVGVTMLPCNWVQCMENSMDPVHVEWLHGRFLEYSWERAGKGLSATTTSQPYRPGMRRRHKKIGADRFEHGLIKRRVYEGGSEEDELWTVGHPVIFPNILRVAVAGGSGHNMQYRVPVDDETTYHVCYTAYRPGIPVPPQESVPLYEIPMKDQDGKWNMDVILVGDFFAWASQGGVAQRDKEHLGQTDVGVIMFRDLLLEQIDVVAQGREPMEVYRDPAKNVCIEFPQEESFFREGVGKQLSGFFEGVQLEQVEGRFSPINGLLRDVYLETEARAARGERLIGRRTGVLPYPPTHPSHKAVDLLP